MKVITNLRMKCMLLLVIVSGAVSAQEISESIQSFSQLKASNSVNVKLIPSNENRLEIAGYDRDEVQYEIKGNRLEIRLSWDNVFSDSNTLVTVYFTNLEEIEANSRSSVLLEESYTGNSMVFNAGEGANINALIAAERVSIKATTGGHIRLIGQADSQEVRVNTGGLYSGREFETKDAEVRIATGGQADIYASESCRVNASLGGTANIFGNPQKVDQKSSLGGNISITE